MCGDSQAVKGGSLKSCSRRSSRVRFPFSASLSVILIKLECILFSITIRSRMLKTLTHFFAMHHGPVWAARLRRILSSNKTRQNSQTCRVYAQSVSSYRRSALMLLCWRGRAIGMACHASDEVNIILAVR